MSTRARKFAGYGAALAALVAVFALYTRPDMMVAVGEMVWACFQ
jgi:hypothetical protein